MDTSEPLLLLTIPAVADGLPEARHQVREHLQCFGIESVGSVELAVAEAIENAVLHAYPETDPGEVEVVVIVDDDAVEVVVRHSGIGLEPNPQLQRAGFGVLLMEALADRFEFDAVPGIGTTVRMEFDLPLT
jgi:anti-sigma regulatory factor (Ser/Thr protein kinase)